MSTELPEPVKRWYCVSRDGLATLCSGERDAIETAASQDVDWRASSPHRAMQLVDAAALETQAEAHASELAGLESVRAEQAAGREYWCKQADALRADAERYRWLRKKPGDGLPGCRLCIMQHVHTDKLDAYIDERAAKGQG